MGFFIFVVIITLPLMALSGWMLSQNTYICPNCGYHFQKKWYHLMFCMHVGSSQMLKCPECKKRNFCRKKED